MVYNYKINPKDVGKPNETYHPQNPTVFLVLIIILTIIVIIFWNSFNIWVLILYAIIIAICISLIMGTDEQNSLERVRIDSAIRQSELDQKKINSEAEQFSSELNNLLSKSHEIAYRILPSYASLAEKHVELAKNDFVDNAYSPFWSQIEEASNFLALYIDAVNQLCHNSELYQSILSKSLANLDHNFPNNFPFSTEITINRTALEYKMLTRRAHTDGTFSIIWEQRRNTQVLAGGFRTLESAILNMSTTIQNAIDDLNLSLQGNFEDLKYLKQEHLESFQGSINTLGQTLSIMDTKLYYIQWKKRPLDDFQHR